MFKIKYFINQSDKKNVVGARASKQTDIKMYDPIRGLVSKAGAHERSPKPSQIYLGLHEMRTNVDLASKAK